MVELAEYPMRPLVRKNPGILFFTESGELRLMNYAAIGDQVTGAFIGYMESIGAIERAERGCGMARHTACVVRDRDTIERAAKAQGVKVIR